MPGRTVSRHVGIAPHDKLMIMIFFGMVRSAMNSLSFAWDGNVQEVWNLPGPPPSFSAAYHFDYWLKIILSFVVLFRNSTTHLHLLFYVIMLYPILTGKQHNLMLPWLHLQMWKNIVTDVICTVIGVLLCWLLHSCGILTLEFLVVRIISTIPSIYLWRRLRAYYFDLYYAELDGECSIPAFKPDTSLTLAQRRRAAKSLDGAMLGLTSPDEGARVNSCLTYEEFFGLEEWNVNQDKKISRSLTTLLTNESQGSDDTEADSRLQIIDDTNLTPAEKTMRILGITREHSDVAADQFHKKTSTTDMTESNTDTLESWIDSDLEASFVSVTRESNDPGTVATQVRFLPGLENAVEQSSKKCVCCEKSKCSGNDDEDSDEGDVETVIAIVASSRTISVANEANDMRADRSNGKNPSNCCNRNHDGEYKGYQIKDGNGKMERENEAGATAREACMKDGIEPSAVSTRFTYHKRDLCPVPRLQAIVERDGIVWENFKEINFVSVIDKVLCDEFKLFKLQKNYPNGQKSGEDLITNSKNLFEDSNARAEDFDKVHASTDCGSGNVRCESSQSRREIFPEREDGTRFTDKPLGFSAVEKEAFYVPTSASFGVDSDVLTLNASYVFDDMPVSGIQSFDSTSVPTDSLARTHQEIGFDSNFQSSFEEHSNMFNYSRTEFDSFQYGARSSICGTAHTVADYSPSYQINQVPAERGIVDNGLMTSISSYDSSQLPRPSMATKKSENTCSSGHYRSTNHTQQFQRGNRDSWNFSREVSAENKINCTPSICGSEKSRDLTFAPRDCYDYKRGIMISDEGVQVSSSITAEEIIPSGLSHPRIDGHKLTRVSQTTFMEGEIVSNDEVLVRNAQTSDHAGISFLGSVKIEKSTTTSAAGNESFADEESPLTVNKLASRSRSTKSTEDRKTSEKWEDKTLKALKAYNEKTLYKYKREMDARKRNNATKIANSSSRQEQKRFLNRSTGSSFSTQQPGPSHLDRDDTVPLNLSAAIYKSRFNQALYVPSAPELETPEKELILNIEKAYARFTRSKPAGPVAGGARYQSVAAKEFFDLYSGGGRLRKESQRMNIGEEIMARKQHSKYSKLSRETNESDITSRSCKQIEGSQKGRDLDKILAKENIVAQEIEVYFLERPTDDKPTSSKNLPITMIKSFSRKLNDDTASAASSGTLTPDDSHSPVIELLENPEDIPRRIDDTEYYRQLRRNNVPENVREAMNNIDWSFRRPYCVESSRSKQEELSGTIVGTDDRLERQNIVQKTTENILQSVFANSENSERGFHLGESENEYYPIFNNVAITMGEIVKAAALRGYRNEFVIQPAREIEVPETDDENFYGPLDPPCESLGRLFSKEFLTCSTRAEDAQVSNEYSTTKELPSMIQHVREKGIWKSGRCEISPDEEETSSLPRRFSEGLTRPAKEREDTSGDLSSSDTSDLKDYSKFLFKGSSTPERSPTSSRYHNPERFLQAGSKTELNCDRLKLALQDIIHNFPPTIEGSFLEIPQFSDNEKPQYELDFESCRRILDHYNTGEKELQSAIVKFLDAFPQREIVTKNGNSGSPLKMILDEGLPRSLRGSEFIEILEMLSVLNLITTTTGKMINLTDNHGGAKESPNSSIECSSREQNERSERQRLPESAASQPGTSSTMFSDHVNANPPTRSNELGLNSDRTNMRNNMNHRARVKIESDPNSRYPSPDEIHEDKNKFLLSYISTVDDVVPPKNMELLNRENFRREAIDSGIVRAIREGQSSNRPLSRTDKEIERLETETIDTIEREEFTATNNEDLNASESCNSANLELETNVHRRGDEFLIDSDNILPDLVIGDIETMESLIRKMKTVIKQFVAGNEQIEKEERASKVQKKVSSLTNLTFLVHGEVQKLRRLVKIVANHATVAGCSPEIVSSNVTAQSPSEIKSSYEVNDIDVRRRELTTGNRPEKSGAFQNVAKGPVKDEEKSNSDDYEADPSHRSSRRSTDPVDRFASWDKMIPLSTRRLITKNRRKSKPTNAVAVREPPRRIVKVIKLVDQNDADFFSAKSVPQKGRGLSSGYLMDSDSDGNFTVSRPPTPASIESDTSQTLSCNVEKSDVISNHSVKGSEVIATSETVQSSRRSSFGVLIRHSSSLTCSTNLRNNLTNFESESIVGVNKSYDDVKSSKNQRSSEKSLDLLTLDSDVSSEPKAALSDVVVDDGDMQRDEKLRVLSAEILLTDNAMRNVSPIDARKIVDKLTNEVQQILIHQFRGVNCLTIGLPVAPKNESFTLSPDSRRADSSIDIQRSTDCDSVENVVKQNRLSEDGEKGVEEILRDLVEELIVNCRENDGISENSGTISFEVLRLRSTISLKHVATETEYTAAVLKDLMEMFSIHHSIGNSAIRVRGSKNGKVDRTDDRNDIEIEKQIIPMAERSHDAESSPGYSNAHRSKRTSNSSRVDSPLSKSFSKNSISGTKLPQLIDSREGRTIDGEFLLKEEFDATKDRIPDHLVSMNYALSNECIVELGQESVLEKVHTLNPSFASYDSFGSLLSQKRNEASEKSSREISLSDQTFLEEFPDQANRSYESCSQPTQLFDKRSSELIQSNSQHDAERTSSDERRGDNNSRVTSAVLISSESNSEREKKASANETRDT